MRKVHSPSTDNGTTTSIPWILHIDMDAFYASIEQLDDPTLRGLPIVVGGSSVRGVVSAASYEARKFGVRSAMPAGMVKRLCPQVIFVPGRMQRYKELSQIIMQKLGDFSPTVEPASIDEAYLDAQGLERLFGPIESFCSQIQESIKLVTGGLSCSIGAAPKKYLAKIASDLHKPHGVYVLYPEHIKEFLQKLTVQKIPGVGKKFLSELQKLGVKTCGDVLRFPEEFWERRFGKGGIALWHKAIGHDDQVVCPISMPKSESAEITFEQDTADISFLQKMLFAQAERVGASLRKKNLSGRTITLKIKFSDFTQITRSRTFDYNINTTQNIFTIACDLLKSVELKLKVRLVGLGVSGFDKHTEQGFLFQTSSQESMEKHRKIDLALDTLRKRFGHNSIVRGRLFSGQVKN